MTDDPGIRLAFDCNPGQPISAEDIAGVEAEWTDGGDEPQFAWLFRLKDGRYAAATGGHDYTGWDCQSHLDVTVHASKEDAIRFGFDEGEREELGLSLPDEKK